MGDAASLAWRESVDRQLAALKASDEQHSEAIHRVREEFRQNTEMTARVESALSTLTKTTETLAARTLPIAETVETMKKGAHYIGAIGDVGSKLFRPVLWVIGITWFIKALLSGAGWDMAVASFFRAGASK
jgi:hypothetical protein